MRRAPSEEHHPPGRPKLNVLQMLVCTDRLVKAGKVPAGKFGALMTGGSSPRRPGLPQLFRERS